MVFRFRPLDHFPFRNPPSDERDDNNLYGPSASTTVTFLHFFRISPLTKVAICLRGSDQVKLLKSRMKGENEV